MWQRYISLLFISLLVGCGATSVATRPSQLGQPSTWEAMTDVIDKPGPIQFEKHLSAYWAVDLSGLVNLDHPTAKAAGLKDRTEPIEIYTYRLTHPEHGTFLVDSGISESLRKPKENTDIAWIIRQVMDTDSLRIVETTHEIEAANGKPINGVFLTHIHLDHILGIADLREGTRVYLGPDDATLNRFDHLATQGTTDRLIANAETLREWQFDDEGIIDVFGDGSVFAIHAPGHTPGSTAYLVRTTDGPELLLGDTCHTAWGWTNGVEPGTFSNNLPQSVVSLKKLIDLTGEHPGIGVHPGHQSL